MLSYSHTIGCSSQFPISPLLSSLSLSHKVCTKEADYVCNSHSPCSATPKLYAIAAIYVKQLSICIKKQVFKIKKIKKILGDKNETGH